MESGCYCLNMLLSVAVGSAAVALVLTMRYAMSSHVYKLIEVAGSSPLGYDDAVKQAVAKAAETVAHLDWFEVTEMRGHIQNGQIAHFQVVVKIGFRLE